MGRAGFVAHENVADPLVTEQGIINRQHCAAGVAEHTFDSLGNQAFDQNIRAAALVLHAAIPSRPRLLPEAMRGALAAPPPPGKPNSADFPALAERKPAKNAARSRGMLRRA
jgi:hypothetical protein